MKVRGVLGMTCLLFVLKTQAASIQFVSIGVDGLTCSMCTRSVEMSIRRLDFVDSVVMDLENTEGKVYLKTGQAPDFRQLAKAVTKAGFSVRFIRISVDLIDFRETTNCFAINGNIFQWINSPPSQSTSVVAMTLIGEEFMPRKKAVVALRRKPKPCLSDKPVYYVSIQ